MQPAISCVIPVYNGKRDLRRAVDSVLAQRPDAQLVLVDDCSTDGTGDMVLELQKENPRIVALRLPANRGQGYARNLGVAAADAEVIAFLDQDDEHLPGWYDHALEVLEDHPEYVGVRGEVELAGLPAELAIGRGDPRWAAIVNSPIWNVVMHKAVYQAVGGSPCGAAFRTRQGNEDWVVTETIKRHYALAKTERVAVRHYVRPGNATDYFLRRTRVVGERFEFTEATPAESGGALAEAVAEYQARAAANVARLRPPLRPAPRPEPDGVVARLVRRITGA